MNWLYGSMAIFISYPALAAAIGAVFAAFGLLLRRRQATVVGGAWLASSVWEFGMKLRWLCSGECNIRIDLLVIYPVLAIGVLFATISLLRRT